jgi:hypothetical protein
MNWRDTGRKLGDTKKVSQLVELIAEITRASLIDESFLGLIEVRLQIIFKNADSIIFNYF